MEQKRQLTHAPRQHASANEIEKIEQVNVSSTEWNRTNALANRER
jgi:hypothetical protein